MTHKVSVNISLGLLIAVILFHMAIIAKAIPYNIAWGGRLQNDSQMYVFEALSILINLFLGLVLLMKGGYINYWFKRRTIDIILWVFLVIFVLNTVGNLFAKTNFEKLFAALTLVFAILIWRVLKAKQLNTAKKNELENRPISKNIL
jgi:membrane protease YdiL (CAAX protease family)